jgi:hypothetical protein
MKARLAASLLLAVPTMANAQRVFDTHVHIWNGETSVRAYEAQLKETHQTVARFAGILIAERGRMAETRRKNDELIALATKYPRERPIDPGHSPVLVHTLPNHPLRSRPCIDQAYACASRRLDAVIVQDARSGRSCHAGYRAQVFVNCPQLVVGHALEEPPRHDL